MFSEAIDANIWIQNIEVLKPLVQNKDFSNLLLESNRLAKDASSQNFSTIILPLATIAIDAQSLSSSDFSSVIYKRIQENLDLIFKVINRESISTEADRVRNEDLIYRKIDNLEDDIKEFQKANLGLKAIWNKLIGGADLTTINEIWVAILQEIMTTPLTSEGKNRLLTRHQALIVKLDTHIIKLVGGGAFTFLILSLIQKQFGNIIWAAFGSGVGKVKEKVSKHAKTELTKHIEKLKGTKKPLEKKTRSNRNHRNKK